MFYSIKSIVPNASNYSIQITYIDNVIIQVNFNDLLEVGAMRLLKDPTVFSQVQIGNRGRSIIWLDQDIEFCADSLLLKFLPKPDGVSNSVFCL